jgi:hypothetical protein
MHGGKDLAAIAALVPGRTQIQCTSRWYDVLNPSIDRPTARAVPWTADEDNKLKDAVQLHGCKDWAAIAALVPGRTKIRCIDRWHIFLKFSIDQATARSCPWIEDEDDKLRHAVHMHHGKDWAPRR